MTATSLTGPGRVTQFLWGANLQNTLTLAYPAAIDQPRFWRAPQPGAETGQVNDGQDAWVQARDFMASFNVRFLYPRAWSDFQQFLDWASGGFAFSLVPDAAVAPLYAVPGCLLVSPFMPVDPALEDTGAQSLQLAIRNVTYDLGLSWR